MRRVGGVVVALAAGLVLVPSAGAQAPGVSAALKAADAPGSQLNTTETSTLPGGAVVSRFGQEVGGVPVVGAGAVVLDPIGGSPELLFDKTHEGLAAPGQATLSRAAAIDAAIGSAKAKRVSARQVIVPGGDGTLAWEVSYSTRKPLGDFVVTLSAASGEMLSKRNLIRTATGQAQVFVPNAVVENDGYGISDGGTFDIKDHGDDDSAALTALRSPVALENIDNGQDCLRGDWVNVKYGKNKKSACKASLNWSNVTRHSNKFEALMVYHHVDQAQEYIQTLGLPAINEESQDALVDTIPDDNSFYSPSFDRIEMGSGGVDDAEDADVFVHEYGHAVQDAQTPGVGFGASSESGAEGEGWGDYFAEAYSTEAVGFDAEWSHCVMEWDATSYDDDLEAGICLRRTDLDRTWSQQQDFCHDTGQGTNEIHCIGEVWSSALFDLRTALGDGGGGDSIMDKVVLSSHELLPDSTPSFQEASEAIIEADEAIYGGSDHCTAIQAELVQRELLSPLTLCT